MRRNQPVGGCWERSNADSVGIPPRKTSPNCSGGQFDHRAYTIGRQSDTYSKRRGRAVAIADVESTPVNKDSTRVRRMFVSIAGHRVR